MKKLLVLLFTLFSVSLFAQDLYIPDRPGYTYSPQTIGYQDIDVELGFGYLHQNYGDETNLYYNTTAFRYGAFKRVEFRGEIDFGNVKSVSGDINQIGVSGAVLGAKFDLYHNDSIVNVGLVATTYIPNVGPNYFVYSNYSPSLILAFQKNIGIFSIFINVGEVWNGINPNSPTLFVNSQGTASISAYCFPTQNFGLFVETASKFSKDVEHYNNFDCGFVYSFSENFICDLSAGLNYKKGFDDAFVNCGVAWKIKNNK